MTADPLDLANELIAAGIPVIVSITNPNYNKPRPDGSGLDQRDMLYPAGWSLQAASDCDLAAFRPGVDALLLVGGHGVDVVDVDAKDGGTVDNLPTFRHFGKTVTPSGGAHFYVRSTGFAKVSPFGTSAGHVGDYVGGTPQGGGRMLAFLPGSTRTHKYPGRDYVAAEPLRLAELLEHEPDENLVGCLVAAGASRVGVPGNRAARHTEVTTFLREHSTLPTRECNYGRAAIQGLIRSAESAVPGDPKRGRHGWAIASATRAVELIRAGCATTADLHTLEQTLDRVKPEGGTDWHGCVAWALTNASGDSGCTLHGRDPVGVLVEHSRDQRAVLVDHDGDVEHRDRRDADQRGETVEVRGTSWIPQDLTEVVRGLQDGTLTRPEPDVGGFDGHRCLFYRGRVNGIHGDSNAGKTWSALATCAQELAAGNAALFIDLEDDAAGTVARLLDLGADPEAVLAQFIYYSPTERLDAVTRDLVAALIEERKPTVAVIDSTGEGLALNGANPNADEEVAAWFRSLPRFIAERGPAVLVLDHMAKADDGSLWPIGSQRKRAAINGAQYAQRAVRPFSRDTAGMAVLICAKDRGGNYRAGQRVAELHVTPHGERVRVDLQPGSGRPGGDDAPFRPTVLMERVSKALESAPEPLTFNDICDRVKGKRTGVRKAVDVLYTEGHIATSPGANNSTFHTSHRPYREDEGTGEPLNPQVSPETGPSGSGSLGREPGNHLLGGSGNHRGTTGEPLESGPSDHQAEGSTEVSQPTFYDLLDHTERGCASCGKSGGKAGLGGVSGLCVACEPAMT